METKIPHKHKMSKISTNKVLLYDIKKINGELNKLLVGYDSFTYKECECGLRQPIKVERTMGA